MKSIEFIKRHIRIVIWLLVIGSFWIALAPKQIGGRYTYIIVKGNSMEPYLKNGDMAILHPGKVYQTGEVVLYRHPDLGPVIHRVTAVQDDRYILQGDNNEWIDSYQPTRSDIEGKLWLHVPRAGKVIQVFRTPFGAAILAGFLGILLFWPDRKLRDQPETAA